MHAKSIGGLSWTNALTALIFAVVTVVILMTFRDYGVSWDEELHVPYGHMLLSYYTSGFSDTSAFYFINLYQYGGFFDLVAAITSNVFPFGEYETRRLVGGAFFLAGLLGSWKLTRLLANERAALIAVACLATTPLLFGHSFINPKDAPLAWLAVWVAYFSCRAVSEDRASWRVIVGVGLSLGLALGTRIIAFAFVAQIGAIIAVKLLALGGTRGWRAAAAKLPGILRPFMIAAPLAFGVMALTWPWSVQAPFNIPSVFLYSANQFWHPTMLWAGELISGLNLPRSYLVVLLAVNLPEYILLGLGMMAVASVWDARALRWASFTTPRTLQYLFVAFTVLVPLAAFAVLRPSTYNGVRHFLFIVPQLVILGALGLDRALEFLLQRRRAVALGFGALLAVLVLREALIMGRIHPYQYLAYNALTGGIHGAYGRFELDYWGVSYAEASRNLVRFLEDERAAGREVPAKARLYVCGANTSAAYYLPETIVITEDKAHADFYMGGDLTNPRCPERPEGKVVTEVRRDDTVLSYVLDLRGARS